MTMSGSASSRVGSLMEYAKKLGILSESSTLREFTWKEEELFLTKVMQLGRQEDQLRKEAFEDGKRELSSQYDAGVLDVGHDDYDIVDTFSRSTSKLTPESTVAGSVAGDQFVKGNCFSKLCALLGTTVASRVRSVSQLSQVQLTSLCSDTKYYVGCTVYGRDDPRNHVVLTNRVGKTCAVKVSPVRFDEVGQFTVALTTPQEFFNVGGRFFDVVFYADEPSVVDSATAVDMSDFTVGENPLGSVRGFGGDSVTRLHGLSGDDIGSRVTSGSRLGRQEVPPPRSVVDESERSGVNNTSGGVVRAKRRVVRGVTTYDDDSRVRRNYQVTGVTMFNNVDEMYLNIISKDYVQEIMDELFSRWRLPTDEPEAMQYAEDLLFAFVVARTASNKADYNAEYSVPTKRGELEVSFSMFSLILTDKYGLTRRNFSRGAADQIRAYLNRPENQFVKARSAQRVGADPQYGDLCFDGSTGCSNVTSSEVTFCRLLEARNLYERDDLIAEGASEKLMQGIHGGVRSVVQR